MPKITYEFDYDTEQESEYYFRNGLALFAAMQDFQNWLVSNWLPDDFEHKTSEEMREAIIDNFNHQLDEHEVSLWP